METGNLAIEPLEGPVSKKVKVSHADDNTVAQDNVSHETVPALTSVPERRKGLAPIKAE